MASRMQRKRVITDTRHPFTDTPVYFTFNISLKLQNFDTIPSATRMKIWKERLDFLHPTLTSSSLRNNRLESADFLAQSSGKSSGLQRWLKQHGYVCCCVKKCVSSTPSSKYNERYIETWNLDDVSSATACFSLTFIGALITFIHI